MNTIALCKSLDHIDNRELARLAMLWKAQASSGQIEALGIAQALAFEQRRRLNADIPRQRIFSDDSNHLRWWQRWRSIIFAAIARINTVSGSRHLQKE
ncbi:MAG: hypothetical protein EOP13_14850 [Pseudomonas sp.]|uniref:hypothetical protein n=1 Tax=Pseudomonas sp. TaxID=306 RepID=UPI0011FBE68C|nr:hypothetical protein [Pseudomonas sp.]RZI72509.1 MAG: hypothetical protein EOP13_14850 [Pseudomonas sp.]